MTCEQQQLSFESESHSSVEHLPKTSGDMKKRIVAAYSLVRVHWTSDRSNIGSSDVRLVYRRVTQAVPRQVEVGEKLHQ